MIELSLPEIITTLIVTILLVKPQDIPKIIKFFKKFFNILNEYKSTIKEELNKISPLETEKENVKEINDYLTKIYKKGSIYNGEYNIESIKEEYENLLKLDKTCKTKK